MYCSNCGSELVKDAAFCSKCGEKVKSIKSKEEEREREEKSIGNIEIETEYQNAGQGRRFINFLIDYYIVSWSLSFLAGYLFPYADETALWVISLLFIILYFFLFETFTGKTLGKLITRTKVLNLLDEKPSAGQVLIRTFCRFIPFDVFSYLSSRPIGWHDSISKTYVAEKVTS